MSISTSASDDKYNHGILMSVAWACLAVIGIFVARYFKYTSWWIYIHILFLLATALITVISPSQIYQLDMYPVETISTDTYQHSRIAMTMSSIVISQVTFGFLSSYFKVFTKNTYATILISALHRVVGWTLLITGLINCYNGWSLYGGTGMALIVIAYVVIAILFISFELYQIFIRNKKPSSKLDLPLITHLAAIAMIDDERKLMFADDLLVDVADFALGHPGGTFMILNSIGEDSGKYMVGCSSYGESLNPYTHSDKAFSLLKNLAIARIEYPSGYLISDLRDGDWIEATLLEKVALNEHTYLIYLKSEVYKLAMKCHSPSWLGKHFQFKFNNGQKTVKRYYSAVFTDILSWESELGMESHGNLGNDDGNFKFIFKYYQGGAMSSHINSLKIGEIVHIKGPLGPGLLIKQIKGNYLALAGGTGLVPFLDLIHVIWKNQSFVNEQVHITLFVFFREWKDCFAIEILKKLEETHGHWLEIHIVTDNNPQKTEVPDMIYSRIEAGIENAWVCGPSGFNRFYGDFLVKSGLEKKKIVIM